MSTRLGTKESWSKVAKAFGKILRERREPIASQRTFGQLAKIGWRYVGFMERGRSQPTLSMFLRIAKALKVEATELLKLVEVELEKGDQGGSEIEGAEVGNLVARE